MINSSCAAKTIKKGDSILSRIVIISPSYPYGSNPRYSFVKELVDALSNRNIKCIVIAPQSITRVLFHRGELRPSVWRYKTQLDKEVVVFQPKCITFGNLKLGSFSAFSSLLFEMAAKRAYRSCKEKPDVIYGHFWHMGVCAASFSDDVPVVVATGESKIWVDELYSKRRIKEALKLIRGVVCVSSKNREESEAKGLLHDCKHVVLPNGVNEILFRPMAKDDCRLRTGLYGLGFIVIFVGAFSDRKGIGRAVRAIDGLKGVTLVAVGSGSCDEDADNFIPIGSVAHEDLPYYLGAADAFLLPTLAEGCCNAIIEALACGLPIISSDRDFNYDILSKENSILIEPTDIDSIREAVQKIKDDHTFRRKLSEGALRTAANLTIGERAKKVHTFLDEVLSSNER